MRTTSTRSAITVLLLLLGLSWGCTGTAEPSLLLLPAMPTELPVVEGGALVDAVGAELADRLPDVRGATLLDAVPDDDGRCGEAQEDRWVEDPVDSPVVALPGVGYTRSRTAPAADGATLSVVCDHDPTGALITADELQTTGTDQSVGNDYITRVGSAAGRVDVGIPAEAVVAVQQFDDWTLLVPLDPDLHVLRLHGLAGGDGGEGYDVGVVRFLTADGTDVTEASVPLPDVIHGVPRSRGSSVGD